ncbi:hypothetical protein B7463_g3417, partial [Scytalidium lignicola]
MASSPRRPVRIANCSGYKNDPAWRMYEQASLGDVDFITGDYLAEMNMAESAEAYSAGQHEGFEATAFEGISQSLEILARKGTKVVINGGSLNPAGLAKKIHDLAKKRGLQLKIGYVSGDDLMTHFGPDLASMHENMPKHLDSANPNIHLQANTFSFLEQKSIPIVLANAYLGARAIVEGLRQGTNIIICGRVADASPVIGAAWYWHSWSSINYDSLAGALIAGHLIECSAYVTGGNFSGFTEHDLEAFLDPGFPITEIDADGSCIITKHENTGGMITTDTVTCQLLYEIQGNMYLNSDVTACLDHISILEISKNRVKVSGVTGAPPPPTTKAAIFYHGGYQSQIIVNATGYGTNKKWILFEKQVRRQLQLIGVENDFDLLEFQIVGVPETNPSSQLRSTTYCRIISEAADPDTLTFLLKAFSNISLQHFSGFHFALDIRTASPRQFLAYYPALYPQDKLEEKINLIEENGIIQSIAVGNPPAYAPLERRANSNTSNLIPLTSFGPTKRIRLGDIALARSGDKGANLNCGIFVRKDIMWPWLQNYLSREMMMQLIGDDWKDGYFLERVEFPKIRAVHFVIYGILGRGVSSSSRLDNLGKAFADYIRDKWVDVPESILL